MKTLYVHRLNLYAPVFVGTIEVTELSTATFTYDADYLQMEGAIPLSASLPLQSEPYLELAMLPYFNGLLPEGEARNSLAVPRTFSTTLLQGLRCCRSFAGRI